MARKKSLQKLLEEYECDGQLSIFDLEDPFPEIKGSARRRASAIENPRHLDAYYGSHIHHYYRCIYTLVDHVKHLRQRPSEWMVRFVGKTDYMPLNFYVETYCTFDTDLISEVISLG